MKNTICCALALFAIASISPVLAQAPQGPQPGKKAQPAAPAPAKKAAPAPAKKAAPAPAPAKKDQQQNPKR